jgi:hypothetical protein
MLRGPLLLLSLTAFANGQCGVQSVVTQAMNAPPCAIFVDTVVRANLSAPCQLGIQATVNAYPLFQPQYAVLALGDAPANVPMPGPFLSGCMLVTNAVVVLWQPYTSSQATFSFAIPPIALPVSLYAQVATISQYLVNCQRGLCIAYLLTATDGLQITLQ